MVKVKPSYDNLIFGLVIGGLEAQSEGVFHIYSVWRGQDHTCTASLSIGSPVHKQPPDGQIGLQLGSFGRLCWGEFHDEICQDLPFYCCPWFVSNVEPTQLYSPLISLLEVSGLCNICFIGYSVGTSMV